MSSPIKRARRSAAGLVTRTPEGSLPLQVALLYIVVRAFPFTEDNTPVAVYSTSFTVKILEAVSREVFEIDDGPATFEALRTEVNSLVNVESTKLAQLNEKLSNRGHNIPPEKADAANFEDWMEIFRSHFMEVSVGCTFLDSLEKQARSRLNEDDDSELTEMPEPIERRSPLGVFIRGVLLTLRKLSFDETSRLAQEVGRWCGVVPAGPSSMHHLLSLNRKLAMEDTIGKRSDAMEALHHATNTGDHSGALAALRRFYDYQLPSANKAQHQHALLNLASFHYSTGGLASSKAALTEAIRVARAENDRSCLRHCMSLMHRLDTETTFSAFASSEKVRINQQPLSESRLPLSINPMDDLWSVRAALDLGEPAHVAMRRAHLALARSEEGPPKPPNNMQRETKDTSKVYKLFHEGAWQAIQAGLWTIMGRDDLAIVHENLALDSSADNADVRLTILLSKAERASRHSDHDAALSLLLDFNSLSGMTLQSYHRWASQVWSLLERQAFMSGDLEAADILHSSRPPATLSTRYGPGGPNRELGQSFVDSGIPEPVARGIPLAQEEVASAFRKARKMQDAKAPAHLILPDVLAAVHLSAELGMWPLYHFGIILLAEVFLSMEGQGLAQKAIDEVMSVWDQVMAYSDEELIARGALVLGRAFVELDLDGGSDEHLGVAVSFLQQARTSAKKLGFRGLIYQCDTSLALLDQLNENADETSLRDWREFRTENAEDGDKRKEEVRKVVEIVKMVGVRVAEGWEMKGPAAQHSF